MAERRVQSPNYHQDHVWDPSIKGQEVPYN